MLSAGIRVDQICRIGNIEEPTLAPTSPPISQTGDLHKNEPAGAFEIAGHTAPLAPVPTNNSVTGHQSAADFIASRKGLLLDPTLAVGTKVSFPVQIKNGKGGTTTASLEGTIIRVEMGMGHVIAVKPNYNSNVNPSNLVITNFVNGGISFDKNDRDLIVSPDLLQSKALADAK